VTLGVVVSFPPHYIVALAAWSVGAASIASLFVLFFPSDSEVTARREHIARILRDTAIDRVIAKRTRTEAQSNFRAADAAYQRLLQRFQSELNRLLACDWGSLTGIPFENFLAAVFREHGYDVETTKTTGDQGIDLVITLADRRLAIQAKGYPGSTVGNSAVQEAHAGMTFYRCHGSVVITNSTFTKGARELAASVNCILIDGSQIPDLIRGRIRL
jgi:HJR/Mrr/RecB family endonuclease